ncbi:MAG: type II toxin-antitoxin system Phd/YefM family antitoxin [Longimicrobiales bacterium]|nr:type II toxin-antitoxin system Phd/YefM family antitoxin [Longimicrobiales bacterium]
MIWKLEDAKNRFSEVVRRARDEGPQFVTKHGRESVVVLGIEEYRALAEGPGALVGFFADSPFGEAVREGELRLERAEDLGRDVEL